MIKITSAGKKRATICLFGGFGWLPKQTNLALKKLKLDTKVLERIQMGDVEYMLLDITPAKITKVMKESELTGEYALFGKKLIMQDLAVQDEVYPQRAKQVRLLLKPLIKAYTFV